MVMALVVKKKRYHHRGSTIISAWMLGIIALLSAPLSQAITVSSPSGASSVSKNLSPTHSIKFNSPIKINSMINSKKDKATSNVNVSPTKTALSTAQSNTSCQSSATIHAGLISSTIPQLQKLAEYEQVCESAIIDRLSFFTAIPTTLQQASDYANDVATRLNEFGANNIKPLIFFEPTNNGSLIDMLAFQSGAYDPALDAYFSALKTAGITDQAMGIWVPFPEGNIPVWTSVNPNVFADCVTKTITYQKKYFPNSKAGILLDSITYPVSKSWSGGQAVSFMPYIKNIPNGLIDSFGLQGFPWSAPANQSTETNGTPANYLRVDLAAEAAHYLGISDVWLNTGSFSSKYTGQAGLQVTVTPEQRLNLLHESITQAKKLQAQGFMVSIHIFAEDKSLVPEATNWSYWSSSSINSSLSTSVFKSFVNEAQASNLSLWLFDTN